MSATETCRNGLAQLASRLEQGAVVVGVGNDLRGDDAAGALVARKLAASGRGPAAVDCGDTPENYLGPILRSRPTQVVFCDAVDFGGAPGEVRVIETSALGAPTVSTHGASLALLAKVLRAEGVEDVFVIGIQPAHTAFGSGCSRQVAAAVEQVVAALATMRACPGTAVGRRD